MHEHILFIQITKCFPCFEILIQYSFMTVLLEKQQHQSFEKFYSFIFKRQRTLAVVSVGRVLGWMDDLLTLNMCLLL